MTKKITKESFDILKELYSVADNIPSDEEIIDKLIEKEVIYQQALKDNISVSEEEINQALQAQKDAEYKDSKTYEDFTNLIQGKNISEDEYWDKMKESIKKGLICGKYINKLKEDFKKENPHIKKDEFQSKYEEYYKNKVLEMKKNIKIEKLTKK